VELDYILENREGHWVIVNYIADGVDTVRNYQSQFSRIIARKSVDFLIGRLGKKNRQYRKERGDFHKQ
jgi:ABC-type transporter MlaC component